MKNDFKKESINLNNDTSPNYRKKFSAMAIAGCCILLITFTSCKKKEESDMPIPTPAMKNFKVSVENVFPAKTFFTSGIYNTAIGASAPAPIIGGQSFEFTFDAPIGSKLSFTSMFGQSNDVFYAPAPKGIPLYTGNDPYTGDVTDQIYLWDAGTELNQEPGVGPDQAARQMTPNTGTSEMNPVQKIENVMDGFTYPTVSSVLKVTIMSMGGSKFKVALKNVSTPTTLMTSKGGMPTPVSPGVWVIHTMDAPLFQENKINFSNGLEAQAEDGIPANIGASTMLMSGYSSPIAPGIWVVHTPTSSPLFTAGMKDNGKGLEALAEDANPASLSEFIKTAEGVKSSGIYTTGVGASMAGPIKSGQKFEFTVMAVPGDHLSFASMLGESNDGFFAFSDKGISLFSNEGTPVSGDVSSMIYLWDAGTEFNEYPGAGANQAPRQPAANSGKSESNPIKNLSEAGDGFVWPMAPTGIKVTITPM